MTSVAVEPELDAASLVREYQADVWRYLRYLGCDAARADDLVQETFLAVIRRPFEQRSHHETAAYLRRVARHRLLTLRRREGREHVVGDLALAEEVWADATAAVALDDWHVALADCLATAVTPRVREALALQYSDNESRQRIAEMLKMTADGIKTMLRRARTTLRKCIQRKLKT